MKKTAIILAALLAATAARAAEPTPSPFYVTAAAGATHISVDCTGTTSCDKTGTGGKVMAGYRFGNGFSLEGGYIYFGKARAGDATSSALIKPSALVLGGAYALPLEGDWGVVLRLGVGQVKTRAKLFYGPQSGAAAENETKLYAGLGVNYAVSNSVKLELGVDTSQGQLAGQKGNLRLISLGATFSF